jgi:hypothetical protein
VAPLSATWMLPVVSRSALVRTVGVEIVVSPGMPRAAVWKLASPDWMERATRCWRDSGFCELSSIVIRLSGRTLKDVPSAKRISAAAPAPVRTRSFWRSTTAVVAWTHSSVPALFTWTLPSREAKRAPVSMAVAGGGAGGGERMRKYHPATARSTIARPARTRVR